MASLDAAEIARAQNAQQLLGLGAHALEVAQLGPKTSTDFGVVAYFSSRPKKPVPKTIEVTHRRKKHVVPVRVKVAERFQPEAHLE